VLLEQLSRPNSTPDTQARGTPAEGRALRRFKMLADFEWTGPNRFMATVERVFTLDFLAKGENVVLVAPQGLGKTHVRQESRPSGDPGRAFARFLTASELLLDLNGQETARRSSGACGVTPNPH